MLEIKSRHLIKVGHIGPTQVKCRLLISSIFLMSLGHFLENAGI